MPSMRASVSVWPRRVMTSRPSMVRTSSGVMVRLSRTLFSGTA
jgi:hypothetical protein